MFTGIIEATGSIESVEQVDGDVRLSVNTGKLDVSDVSIGDSICTNGCCLTVVQILDAGFVADVSTETLKLTTLKSWSVGTSVNLEKALTPMTRMGGHMVSGHVDGTAVVISREPSARAEVFWLAAPAEFSRYISHKGSITIDGTSLTVNEVNGNEFCLTIVPHTLEETIMSSYKQGSEVNLEVDLVARYLERLHMGDSASVKRKRTK